MGAVVAGHDLDIHAPRDAAHPCGGAPVGAYYIDSLTGFPVLDNTQRVIGNPNPRWTGSIRSSFRYRKLQLSGLLDIRHGGQMDNGTKAALYAYGTHKDTEVRADCSGATCVGNAHVIGQAGSPIVVQSSVPAPAHRFRSARTGIPISAACSAAPPSNSWRTRGS